MAVSPVLTLLFALVTLTLTLLLNAYGKSTSMFIALLVLPLVAFSWRVFRQAALHQLYPGSPEELPSWIPYFGHLASFINDFGNLLSQVRSQSSSSGGPASLLLGGSSVCFITSAKDSQSIHKNSSAFDHDKFLQLTARQFGVSRQGVQTLWTKNGSSSFNSKPIANIMAIVRRELSALRRPDGLPNTVLQQIQLLSSWENWSTRSVHKSGEEMRIISLSRWIRDIFMQASTQVLFGDTMMQLSPNLMEDFYTFDDRSWMVLYSIPMPWSLKMRLALKRTQHAIKIYLNLSPKRKSDASLVMKQLEEAMKGEGFLQGDAPAVLSLIYWGFNTNAWKACFWCMCYIINDPNLLNAITEEVQPIVETSSCPADLAANLRQCPKLKSTYLETLRFTASTGSARESQTEQLLGGKKIRAHTDLVIVYREMLMDSDIFGIDSDKFVWHRFLNNDELSKGPGFRPFGGGVGQCPGRFLAQSEILSLIALAVTRFNLEVDVVSSVPDLDTKTPSLGMMGPVNGQDMLVRVTRKISEQPDKTSHLARIGS